MGRIEGPGRKTRLYCTNSSPNRSDYHASNDVSLTVYFISANNTGVSYSNFSSGFTADPALLDLFDSFSDSFMTGASAEFTFAWK